jgi:RNA polymerase sigma factor for flagellar operon FliA
MGVFQYKYPHDLRSVILHARRLSKLLEQLEARPASSRWFIGRASELRALVGSVVADWKAGHLDNEETSRSIRSYVDSLHRDAARRLRSGEAFACCRADEALTVIGDIWSTTSITRADSVATALSTPCAHTVQRGWVDGPDVMALFESELGRVEACARMLAKRIRGGRVTLDDLRAFGREGLLDAARSFNEGREVPFGRWAAIRIRGAILDGLGQWGSIPRTLLRELIALEDREWDTGAPRDVGTTELARRRSAPVSRRTALDEDARCAMVALEANPTPEEALAKAQVLARVRELVAELPERERELVQRCCLAGESVEQVSARLGMTRSWGSRKLSRAIESMRRELQGSRG